MSMAAERVRGRLDSLASSGLDLATFALTAVEVLTRAVPAAAACLAPADPATELITATVKWGGLTDNEDDQWAFWEYESDELWNFQTVARRPGGVTSTYTETAGRPELSRRHVEFFERTYGFRDELRAALRIDGNTWGFIALFRDGGSMFTPAEQAFVSTVAPMFARGFRAALVTGSAAAIEVGGGPAVLVVDAGGRVVQAGMSAAAMVVELGGGVLGESPLPMPLLNLVGSARAFTAGRHSQVPRMRLRTRSGGWVVAHASPMTSLTGGAADIVVTVEEARPPDIIPLVVAAYGLTHREQAVVQQVLQGIPTAEIAVALHVSAYTVQDHLKSVFEKAGVRSRRELTARVFLGQYAPRMARNAAPSPSGWFVPPDPVPATTR